MAAEEKCDAQDTLLQGQGDISEADCGPPKDPIRIGNTKEDASEYRPHVLLHPQNLVHTWFLPTSAIPPFLPVYLERNPAVSDVPDHSGAHVKQKYTPRHC